MDNQMSQEAYSHFVWLQNKADSLLNDIRAARDYDDKAMLIALYSSIRQDMAVLLGYDAYEVIEEDEDGPKQLELPFGEE